MRLISCTIENIGKLNNVTYDFSGECNTICEDNGWGKSTLASFIRVMFYGFKNDATGLSNGEAKPPFTCSSTLAI